MSPCEAGEMAQWLGICLLCNYENLRSDPRTHEIYRCTAVAELLCGQKQEARWVSMAARLTQKHNVLLRERTYLKEIEESYRRGCLMPSSGLCACTTQHNTHTHQTYLKIKLVTRNILLSEGGDCMVH